MTRKTKGSESEDEMRAEYDLSKMKLVGRGIYAERFRAGVKIVLLDDNKVIKRQDTREDRLDEQPQNISNSTER